jgi:hypothetical protein
MPPQIEDAKAAASKRLGNPAPRHARLVHLLTLDRSGARKLSMARPILTPKSSEIAHV